jgi:lysophospholipase L1-like esterase
LRRLLIVAVLAVLAAVFSACAASPPARPAQPAPPPARPAQPAPPVAVFLGDSYTQGDGATAPGARWVNLVATAKGWDFVNLGRGGTGYLVTSSGCGLSVCPNYAGMIPEVAKESPDVIVVAGGQNEFHAFNTTRQDVIDAIRKTYAELHARFPEAQIIAVGPSTPWDVNPDVALFDRVVQDAAASAEARYVSLIEPNVIGDGMLAEDKVHVNDAGHRAIAERVTAALR